MVSLIVRIQFHARDQERIAEMVRALTAATRQEPGCVTYVPHFVADDPGILLIYEQYRDEAGLEAHRNSPHFKQYGSGGLYQMMIDRKLENLNALA